MLSELICIEDAADTRPNWTITSPCFYCCNPIQTVVLLTRLLAWSGFTTAADRRRLDMFIRRSKRYGYCSPDTLPVSELFDNADNALFRSIMNNSSHILGHFLSLKSRNKYNTRHRKHNFELIKKTTSLSDRNFLIRMLYRDIY